MEAILSEIVTLLVSGISSFGTGLAGGIGSFIQSLFIDSTGDTMKLAITGGVITVFAAIALTTGITEKIWYWLSSLGGRK